MDQKDIEKTIQFILDQQAKFAADIQQISEAQKQAEGRLSGLEGAVVIGVNLINDLTKGTNDLTKNVSALAEAHKQTENTVSELAEKVDAFITTVERYISEGRNGKPSA